MQEALGRLGCGPEGVRQRVDELATQVVQATLEERRAEREAARRAEREAAKRRRQGREEGGGGGGGAVETATREMLGW